MDIDAVVLWVDGEDPLWLEEKMKFMSPEDRDSNSVNRYRDWGLLPYWFRAIESFAPWLRTIHFVTWGHIPEFLDVSAPKLHIVRHDEFIPKEYLPTFSSHAIEVNIHRIPGLAEHFIYFNDDTFLLKPMQPTDFFQEGLPCAYGAEVPWEFLGEIGTWGHAAANDLGVINRHFPKKKAVVNHRRKYCNKVYGWKNNLRTFAMQKLFPGYFTGFKNLHAPASYLKKSFADVWGAEAELLHKTSCHRFRTSLDVNQWVILWWQVASGCFSPYKIDNLVMGINNTTIGMLCACIEEQKHSMICLNDPEEEVDFVNLSERLKTAFARILPNKSKFEY